MSSLIVDLPLVCSDGRCKGMRLEVVNAKNGVRQKYIINDRMTYTFDLVHSITYNVYISTQQGEKLSVMENIELGNTDVHVTMPNLKSLYDVTLKVVQNDGTNVTDIISIKWFDGQDNFLANSPTMTKLSEGSQLYATLSLPEELARVCELPGRVEHTVATTGNDLTLTLQPLQQNTLAVRVVNDADGKYLSGALVQAHGRYSQVVSATTDIYESTPKSVCKDFAYQNIKKYTSLSRILSTFDVTMHKIG